jgi:glutaredoxin/glutathione-dependent peroxiredoxin
MTISVGDSLPQVNFMTVTGDGHQSVATDVIFAGRKVVLFGVPGAFTPTCSRNHLPGFLSNIDAIKAKGVDSIVCVTVNDIHVVDAWSKHAGTNGKIIMLSDGDGNFARAIGLNKSMGGMGERVRRFSMIVDNGVVRKLNVEDKPGVNVSGADTILEQLSASA